MDHELLTLELLATRLGRDRREVERLVQRGTIPGRKINGVWMFHPIEVTQWLEQELRGYTAPQLEQVEDAQNSQELNPTAPLVSLLKPELVEVPLQARTKRSVLESLIEVAGRSWQVWQPAALLQAVQEREEVFSTGFENGVAIPHPRSPLPDAMGESLVAFGRTFSGIPFGAPRRMLTDIFFLVLCRDTRTHLQILARLGRMLQVPDFLPALREAPDSRSTYELLEKTEQQVATEVR